MPHPFGATSRAIHFGRTVAVFHCQLITLARDIDADIARRGFAGMGGHPKVPEAFSLINSVVDEMLEFDRKVAEYQLKALEAHGVPIEVDVFSEDNEQHLCHWVRSEADRIAETISSLCKRLLGGPNAWRVHASVVANEVSQRIRQTYAERRADFEMEAALAERRHRQGTSNMPAGADHSGAPHSSDRSSKAGDSAGCLPAKEEPVVQAQPADGKRPCYARDHLFLAWYNAKGEETYHRPARIRDKWNALSEAERRRLSPLASGSISHHKPGRVVVETALKKARKETRERTAKKSESKRRKPAS
jgi:hypothetical protein